MEVKTPAATGHAGDTPEDGRTPNNREASAEAAFPILKKRELALLLLFGDTEEHPLHLYLGYTHDLSLSNRIRPGTTDSLPH